MRASHILLFGLAVGACRNPSKLDTELEHPLDALWRLAPPNTQTALVATGPAVGLALGALETSQALRDDPELAPVAREANSLADALFGDQARRLDEVGLAARPFALFRTNDAVVAILPVADRVAFVKAMRGRHAGDIDLVAGLQCKQLDERYVCASPVTALTALGGGDARARMPADMKRGDVELYLAPRPNPTGIKGELVAAMRLQRGVVEVETDWRGPVGPLAALSTVRAPSVDVEGAAGFVAADVSPLRGRTGDLTLAPGVTLDQLLESMRGAVTARAVAGTADVDVHAPLANAEPAAALLRGCDALSSVLTKATQVSPDLCRVELPLVPPLQLDAWIAGTELRAATRRDPAPQPRASVATPIARQLADGTWSFAAWGRGTPLSASNSSGEPLSPAAALGVRVSALVNEVGAGIRVTPTGMHALLYVRTAWANPPEIAARYLAVTAAQIASGEGTTIAHGLATQAPDAPLAGDLDAGLSGLLVPSTLTTVAVVAVPALARALLGVSDAPPSTTLEQREVTGELVRRYVYDAYRQWVAGGNHDCPTTLDQLSHMVIPPLATRDLWGRELGFTCSADSIWVWSTGADGVRGTADDIGAIQPR